MGAKLAMVWALNAAVALSVVGCASEVSESEEDDVGETSDEVRAGGIQVTNPNNASYSNIDGALSSWVNWACMVSAGSKARAVNEQFVAKQKATPKGTKVYWMVYGKYLNGDNKCVTTYNVDFSSKKMYPPVIPLDHRNRPLASYQMGYCMGTK